MKKSNLEIKLYLDKFQINIIIFLFTVVLLYTIGFPPELIINLIKIFL